VTRLLAAAIGLLLILDGVAAATVDRDNTPSRSAATTSTSAASSTTSASSPLTTAAPVDAKFAATVRDLQAFVAQHRGLAFKKPVSPMLLDATTLSQRILAKSHDDDADLVRTGKILAALGLLRPGTDIVKARDKLLGGAILGFYDDDDGSLFVRGNATTPYVRGTLVHELNHADQDQNFNIKRPELAKRDDESDLAFTSIVEGDAVRIESEYVSQLSAADKRTYEKEATAAGNGVDLASAPAVLVKLLYFPYTFGKDFVDAIVKAGGQARLDEAFRNPPTTTEQIMHPDRFLAGDKPKAVADPSPDGTKIDAGVMGEYALQLMLDTALSGSAAEADAAGWGGDRYVAWTSGSTTCIRVALSMDTPTDLQELRNGLTEWAAKQSHASVSGTDPVTFTTCA
jgi:uncharacterized protein DUF6782